MSGGGENVPNAFKFYCLAKERIKEGGFNLCKWLTCDEELARLIAEREQQPPPPGQKSFAKTTINSMSTDMLVLNSNKRSSVLYGIMRMTAFVSNKEVFMKWVNLYQQHNAEYWAC